MKILQTSLLLLFFLQLSPAQTIYEISDIIVVGNDKTKENVIIRELLFKTGDIVSDSLLEISRLRITNLWLFNRVEFQMLPDHGKTALLIMVTEKWYFFPFPVFRIEDRDWSKISYGFGLAHDNFRGRNEKIYVSLIFGERPGYYFNFVEPWIGDDLHLTLNYLLTKFSMSNRLKGFEEKHFDSRISFGKFWSRYFVTKLHFSRVDITVPEEFAPSMITGSRHEINYGLQASIIYDSRDITAYPTLGTVSQFVAARYGLFQPDIDYWKFAIDLRKYVSWKKFTLALRAFNTQSIGELPVYDYIFIGYSQRIRGHFYDVYSGKHAAIASAEVRYRLIPKTYFSLNTIILPSYMTKNLFVGLGMGLFIDSGLAWHKKDEFQLQNFKTGFGAGLHFFLPYVEVFRIDLAFDEEFNSQYIFEVRTAL